MVDGIYCSWYYHTRKGLTISVDMLISDKCVIAASTGEI